MPRKNHHYTPGRIVPAGQKGANSMRKPLIRVAVALTAVTFVAMATILAGCGDDAGDKPKQASGNPIDAAFADQMIAHHQGAIEMAETARKRAEHDEISALADDIIKAQRAEIETLRRIDDALRRDGVKGGSMHMSPDEMGMDGDMPGLSNADPFDRAFIDMMIPHHRGAIAMAKRQLADGVHPELKRLSRAIIAAQSREIEQMQDWRERWYGRRLPEPKDDDDHMMDDGTMMDDEHMMD